ncbi:unnamed protein product [Lactuca saligna]|uniref:STI1 domain-containing protein n=1 Tax=Lactuca saligna TaxID=75948 RepID=A0AA35Z961_LACSI|nr:unnamed protein product [Lactuca saligna]
MLVFGGFQPTRAPNVSGLGGRGLPGADMTGGMPDMSQLLQNPAVSRMMQVLLSNPQYMQQIVSQNPQLLIRIDNTIMKNRNYDIAALVGFYQGGSRIRKDNKVMGGVEHFHLYRAKRSRIQ